MHIYYQQKVKINISKVYHFNHQKYEIVQINLPKDERQLYEKPQNTAERN